MQEKETFLFFGNTLLEKRKNVAKTIYIIKIGSVCLCHGQHAIGNRRYFLAPCDNRPPARPARIPLEDTLCGYRTVVSVSSAL